MYVIYSGIYKKSRYSVNKNSDSLPGNEKRCSRQKQNQTAVVPYSGNSWLWKKQLYLILLVMCLLNDVCFNLCVHMFSLRDFLRTFSVTIINRIVLANILSLSIL